MTEDEFYGRMATMWYDTFGRSAFREDRIAPVEFMLLQYYLLTSGGKPSEFLRYTHSRAVLFLHSGNELVSDFGDMFDESTSGPDVAADDEDLDEYEAAQRQEYETEKKRLEALGLSINDPRSPMEQWGIMDPSELTLKQQQEQQRWWMDIGRWREEVG